LFGQWLTWLSTVLVGTPAPAIRCAVSAGEYRQLFMGRQTLANEWRDIVCWLREDAATVALSEPDRSRKIQR
jgi:hypothetical protein